MQKICHRPQYAKMSTNFALPFKVKTTRVDTGSRNENQRNYAIELFEIILYITQYKTQFHCWLTFCDQPANYVTQIKLTLTQVYLYICLEDWHKNNKLSGDSRISTSQCVVNNATTFILIFKPSN